MAFNKKSLCEWLQENFEQKLKLISSLRFNFICISTFFFSHSLSLGSSAHPSVSLFFSHSLSFSPFPFQFPPSLTPSLSPTLFLSSYLPPSQPPSSYQRIEKRQHNFNKCLILFTPSSLYQHQIHTMESVALKSLSLDSDMFLLPLHPLPLHPSRNRSVRMTSKDYFFSFRTLLSICLWNGW